MIDGTGVFCNFSFVILEVSFVRCFCMSVGCRSG
jgi:hypothetical protein